MQTPRGFLIGAGVIAAIAALTSVGHPHTETAVETTAPIVTDAIEDTTTTNATTTDPETRVLAEHVEAGIDAGAAAASAGAASAGAVDDDGARAPETPRRCPATPCRRPRPRTARTQPRRRSRCATGDALAAGRSHRRQRAADEPGHHARADDHCCSHDHRAPDDARADHRALGHAGHGAEDRRERLPGDRAEDRCERPSGHRAAGRRPRAGGARAANAPEVKSTIAYDLPAA